MLTKSVTIEKLKLCAEDRKMSCRDEGIVCLEDCG